jgi:serine/threonine protein kinase
MLENANAFVLELELMKSTDLYDRLASKGVMTEWEAQQVMNSLVLLYLFVVLTVVILVMKYVFYYLLPIIAYKIIWFQWNVNVSITSLSLSLSLSLPVSSLQVILQLVDAVLHCSRQGIAHRDIKLSNVTFPVDSNSDSASDDIIVKLADFGMAGFIGRDGRLRGRCGTPGFVAPDIIKALGHESYHMNVDMFSVRA